MLNRRITDKADISRAAVAIAVRTFLGLGLSIVLSMTGLAIAWGLFVFSGASERSTFLIMTMAGSAIGAGIGPSISWMQLDRQHKLVSILMLLLCLAGGVIGSLAGYQYGANREIECCAQPSITPFTYVAFGATIGANVVMYLAIAAIAAARLVRGNRGAVTGPS